MRAVAEACAWQGKAEQLEQRLFAMPCRSAGDARSQVALEQERHRAAQARLAVEKKRRQTAEEELWRQRHDPCHEMMAGHAAEEKARQMERAADETMRAAHIKHAECTAHACGSARKASA